MVAGPTPQTQGPHKGPTPAAKRPHRGRKGGGGTYTSSPGEGPHKGPTPAAQVRAHSRDDVDEFMSQNCRGATTSAVAGDDDVVRARIAGVLPPVLLLMW